MKKRYLLFFLCLFLLVGCQPKHSKEDFRPIWTCYCSPYGKKAADPKEQEQRCYLTGSVTPAKSEEVKDVVFTFFYTNKEGKKVNLGKLSFDSIPADKERKFQLDITKVVKEKLKEVYNHTEEFDPSKIDFTVN